MRRIVSRLQNGWDRHRSGGSRMDDAGLSRSAGLADSARRQHRAESGLPDRLSGSQLLPDSLGAGPNVLHQLLQPVLGYT